MDDFLRLGEIFVLRTRTIGVAIRVWMEICGIANQSLNQTPFGRRLVPRSARPCRAESDDKFVLWLGGIVASAMVDGSSQRTMGSGAFFEVSFRAGIVVSTRDIGNPHWMKGNEVG